MKKSNTSRVARLAPLCTLDLQFRWEMAPVTSRTAGEGDYVGSGEGTARGRRLRGMVRWDLFEKREERLCRSHLIGRIETGDGAQIKFDSRGFFIQPDEANTDRWITTAAVRFETGDPRYAWLTSSLAVWEGEFDMGKFQHHYRVYLPPKEELGTRSRPSRTG